MDPAVAEPPALSSHGLHRFAQSGDDSADGEGVVVADMDQTAALMQAVGIVRQARDTGMKVGDLADQLDLVLPRLTA